MQAIEVSALAAAIGVTTSAVEIRAAMTGFAMELSREKTRAYRCSGIRRFSRPGIQGARDQVPTSGPLFGCGGGVLAAAQFADRWPLIGSRLVHIAEKSLRLLDVGGRPVARDTETVRADAQEKGDLVEQKVATDANFSGEPQSRTDDASP